MKKLLIALVLLGTTALGVSNVNAQVIDLNDIDSNSYIIGDRIFELNSYFLNVYDVVSATNEYAKNHQGAIAPIYYLGEVGEQLYLLQILGSANQNTGVVPTTTISDINTVFPDSKMDATAINNAVLEDYVADDIEPKIEAAIAQLNETAKKFGFNSITYNNHTVTFDIADLEAKLEEYQPTVIAGLFKSTLTGAVKAEFNLDKTVTKNLKDATNQDIIGIAADILSYLVGDKDLTYGAVAGKSITATITFENEGKEFVETYTVEFTYDDTNVNAETEASIEEAVKALNEKAKEYGFNSITYKDGTVTFDIADLEAKLEEYQPTEIATLFTTIGKDAIKAEYKLDKDVTKNLKGASVNDIIGIAAELLGYMAGDKALTYGAVAGKEMKATITFDKGGYVYTEDYAVKFTYDDTNVNAETEANIEEAVKALNEEAENYGFNSITYKDGTVTFDIADLEAKLEEYQPTEIATLFTTIGKDAVKAEYKLDKDVTKNLKGASVNDIIGIAAELLGYMAGDKALTYGAVAGKEMKATITFDKGGYVYTEDYTVKFTYDDTNVNAETEEAIEDAVAKLNENSKDYGISSIKYADNVITFNMFDLEAKLEEYQPTEIATLFTTVLADAIKVEYELDNNVTKNLKGASVNDIIGIAAELLGYISTDGELTYNSVVGEEFTATITFEKGGYVYTEDYTVKFAYDIAAAKDVKLNEAAAQLDLEVKANADYGFSSIAYDEVNNIATFTISNPDASLLNFQDSAFLTLFKENMDGAVAVSYMFEGEKVTRPLVEDGVKVGTSQLMNIAAEVLGSIVGENELILNNVANETIEADLIYEVDGVKTSVTYKIAFVM